MQELVIVFLLGCIGTSIRYLLSSYGKYFLLLSNIIGVVLAALFIDYNLILAGLCGSITTLSTLVVLGYKDYMYYLLTVFINLALFYLIMCCI